MSVALQTRVHVDAVFLSHLDRVRWRALLANALTGFICGNQFWGVAPLAGGKGGRDAAPGDVMDALDGSGTRRVSNTLRVPAAGLLLHLLSLLLGVCFVVVN